MLLGILRYGPNGEKTGAFQNILVALTGETQTYVKRHLVPFGEYFPVPIFIRSWMRLMNLPYTDAVPGAADQPPFDVKGERVAITICYEDVFGAEQLHYLPDATLLVNVSNDAWFGDSIAPHQHVQIARVRAAEAGRYMLRATNTGLTAVIDARGNVTKTVPQQLAHDRARRACTARCSPHAHKVQDSVTPLDCAIEHLPRAVEYITRPPWSHSCEGVCRERRLYRGGQCRIRATPTQGR